MPETTVASFVIRFVQDDSLPAIEIEPTWHAAIRHIQTDEETRFTCMNEALTFIGRWVNVDQQRKGAG